MLLLLLYLAYLAWANFSSGTQGNLTPFTLAHLAWANFSLGRGGSSNLIRGGVMMGMQSMPKICNNN